MPKKKVTISAFEKRQIRYGCLDLAARIYSDTDGMGKVYAKDSKEFIDLVNKLSKFVETGEVPQ